MASKRKMSDSDTDQGPSKKLKNVHTRKSTTTKVGFHIYLELGFF